MMASDKRCDTITSLHPLRVTPLPPEVSYSHSSLTPLMKFGSPPYPSLPFHLAYVLHGRQPLLLCLWLVLLSSKPFAKNFTIQLCPPCLGMIVSLTSRPYLSFRCWKSIGCSCPSLSFLPSGSTFLSPPLWSSSFCLVTATPALSAGTILPHPHPGMHATAASPPGVDIESLYNNTP